MAKSDNKLECLVIRRGEHQTKLAYILQLLTLFSALATMILAIIAYANSNNVNKTLEDIYSSWDTMPVMNISAYTQPPFANCAQTYGPDWSRVDANHTWPGTLEGCDCSKMNKTGTNVTDSSSKCQSSYTDKCSDDCVTEGCFKVEGLEEEKLTSFNGSYICVQRAGKSALNRTAYLYDLKDVEKCKSDETVCGPLADFFLNGSTSFPLDITPGPSENYCWPQDVGTCPLVHFEARVTATPNCTDALANSTANGCNEVPFGLFLTWTASAINVLTPEIYQFDWRPIPNVQLTAGDICFDGTTGNHDKTGNKNVDQGKNGTSCPPLEGPIKYKSPPTYCLSGKTREGCTELHNEQMSKTLGLSSLFSVKYDTRYYPAAEINLTEAWHKNGVPDEFTAYSNSKFTLQARPEIPWIDKCPESRMDVYNIRNTSYSLEGLQLGLMLVNIFILIIFWCIFPALRKKDLEKVAEDASGKHHTAFIVKWAAKGGKYAMAMIVVGTCATLVGYFLKVTEAKCSNDLTNVNFWQIWDKFSTIGNLDTATATLDGITGAGDILELCAQKLRSAADSVVED